MTRGYILTLINTTTINITTNTNQEPNPVTYLTEQGLTLTLLNNQLKLTPSYLITKQVVQYINEHKETIKQHLLIANHYNQLIEQLTNDQQQWLADLAYYLGITPEYVIQHQLVIKEDIIEYSHQDSKKVADCLIKGGAPINAELKRN